jgi:hypothetical protein
MGKNNRLINNSLEKERASNRHHQRHSYPIDDYRLEHAGEMDDSDVIPSHFNEENKGNQPDVDNLNYE